MLPQASGIAIARTPRITGAFHGAMPSTTPTGWRIAIAKLFGLSDGITSPAICVVIAAASRIRPAAKWLLKWPHGPIAPHSAVISAENSVALGVEQVGGLEQLGAPLARPERRPGRERRGRRVGRRDRVARPRPPRRASRHRR